MPRAADRLNRHDSSRGAKRWLRRARFTEGLQHLWFPLRSPKLWCPIFGRTDL